MKQEAAADLCIKTIEIGRFPDWMARAFDLLSKENPRDLLLNFVVPVADVLSVASRAIQDELTTVAAVQLPDISSIGVMVQADPANTVDVFLSIGGPQSPHTLTAGTPFAADIANTNLIFIASGDGATPVRVTFTALQL